jgi:hypothetical protein
MDAWKRHGQIDANDPKVMSLFETTTALPIFIEPQSDSTPPEPTPKGAKLMRRLRV